MFILKVVTASIIGTIVMTIFSCFLGKLFSKEFSEPILLDTLFYSAFKSMTPNSNKPFMGWVIHFLFGVVFAFINYYFYSIQLMSLLAFTALVSGTICGLLGIIGWKIMLHLHPDPPNFDVKLFLLQLFFAHLLFSLSTLCIFKQIL